MITIFITTGLFAIYLHWVARHIQGRTSSTFVEYMMSFPERTMSSVVAVMTSSVSIYETLPYSPETADIVKSLITVFTAAYTLDSGLNKDGGAQP